MDTSEKYITMCEKAGEIQKHFLELGDYYAWERQLGGDFVLLWIDREKTARTDSRIWLPRQDQLQEMSGLFWYDFDRNCTSRLDRIWKLFPSITWIDMKVKYSKEQVGLMVVMHEKYRITWDDEKEEWINQTLR